MNEDEAVQVSDPVLEVPPDDDIQNSSEIAESPMEAVPEGSEEAAEAPETDQAASDIPGSDFDPVIGILDDLAGMLSGQEASLDKIGEQLNTVVRTVDHPVLTTPFEEYTVSEALMLLLLLCAFVSACARMLRGGFSWLRS